MPMWNGWLPREGLTADPIARTLKKTVLNPALTLPIILLARYTKRGSDLSILHEKAYKRIKFLFYLGLANAISSYLTRGVLDNWTSDKYDWNKEIVVVTGGSGGIGGEIVKLFAERGVKVVVLDVIPLTFEASSNVYYFKCDVSSTSNIASVAQQIRTQIGNPTILINNAGVARGKSILETSEAEIRFTFAINTFAHYFLTQAFLPSMIAANHGMIVTVSSQAAYMTIPHMTEYCASKAAALSFHEGLTAELKTYGATKVRTVNVHPGPTRTPLFQGFKNDSSFLLPWMEAETVAEAVVKKVLSGTSGSVHAPSGGSFFCYIRGLPWWISGRMMMSSQMLGFKGRQVIDPEQWAKQQAREKEEKERKVQFGGSQSGSGTEVESGGNGNGHEESA